MKIKLFALAIFIFNSADVFSQKNYSIGLEKILRRIDVNMSTTKFIPIDSILTKHDELGNHIKNELLKSFSLFDKKYYYTISVGYFFKDSSQLKLTVKIFEEFKLIFKSLKNPHVSKFDFVCQHPDLMSVEVEKYEELDKTTVLNSIYLRFTKSKVKGHRSHRERNCFF